MTIKATLCHILKEDKVLLLKKSKGLFGGGKWNAPGGKLSPGEEPERCAMREVLEETGLRLKDLRFHGILDFYFGHKEEPDWVVHIFSSSKFSGELRASSEGVLRWFDREEVPYGEMWDDDEHWLPLLLEGKRFSGTFYFDETGEELIDYEIRVEENDGSVVP